MKGDVRAYGDRAWLISGAGDPLAIAQLIEATWPDAEAVVGESTCLARFHQAPPSRAAVEDALADLTGVVKKREGPPVTIEVHYDGEDLAEVGRLCGISPAEVVRLHTGATYRVSFIGFAPGFAYLTGLPRALVLPRRSVPRTIVPAGSVAIADKYSAVYPSASPGGWHLLGHTDARMFDPARTPPALLSAGTSVRFVAADA